MKRLLTVLLAAIALPVFGAGGWTVMGHYQPPCNIVDPTNVLWGTATNECNLNWEEFGVPPSTYPLINVTTVTNIPASANSNDLFGIAVYASPYSDMHFDFDEHGAITNPFPLLGAWTAQVSWMRDGDSRAGFLLDPVAYMPDTNHIGTVPYYYYAQAYTELWDTNTGLHGSAVALFNYNTNCYGCQTATPQWGQSFGGAGNDRGQGVAVDSQNNIYVTGYFTGSGTFSGTNISSIGTADMFLEKLNSSGSLLWIKHYGTSGNGALGISVLVDTNDNVILLGTFTGDMTVDATILTGTNGGMLLAKWTSAGSLLFATNYAGNPAGAVVDQTSGDLLTWGTFSGTQNFGSPGTTNGIVTVYFGGGTDCYLARYSSVNGACQWAKSWPNGSTDIISAVVPRNDSRLLLVGWVDSYINFGGPDISAPPAGTSMFSVLLSSNASWISQWKVDNIKPLVAGIDTQTNIYIAGQFQQTFNMFGTNVVSPDPVPANIAMFLVKFTENGPPLWYQTVKCPVNGPTTLLLDSSNNVSVVGYFQSRFTLSDGEYIDSNSSFGYNVFMVKYSAAGVKTWLDWAGCTYGCGPYGLSAVDRNGSLIMSGNFYGGVAPLQAFRIDPVIVFGYGVYDGFILHRKP